MFAGTQDASWVQGHFSPRRYLLFSISSLACAVQAQLQQHIHQCSYWHQIPPRFCSFRRQVHEHLQGISCLYIWLSIYKEAAACPFPATQGCWETLHASHLGQCNRFDQRNGIKFVAGLCEWHWAGLLCLCICSFPQDLTQLLESQKHA